MRRVDRIARFAQPLDAVKVIKPKRTRRPFVKSLLRAIGGRRAA